MACMRVLCLLFGASIRYLDQPYPQAAGLSGAAQAAVGRDSISRRIGVPEAELELPEGGKERLLATVRCRLSDAGKTYRKKHV